MNSSSRRPWTYHSFPVSIQASVGLMSLSALEKWVPIYLIYFGQCTLENILLLLQIFSVSWYSPHWLCSWPGSRCCSSWLATAEDSRNHRSSCCPPLWMAVPLWDWRGAAPRQCNRASPRWRHCESWQGRRNTLVPQRQRGGSWTCAPPSQQADRSWKHKQRHINICCCVLSSNFPQTKKRGKQGLLGSLGVTELNTHLLLYYYNLGGLYPANCGQYKVMDS